MHFRAEELKLKMREELHLMGIEQGLSAEDQARALKELEDNLPPLRPEFMQWQSEHLQKAIGKVKIDEAEFQRYETEWLKSLAMGNRQKGVEQLADSRLAERAME